MWQQLRLDMRRAWCLLLSVTLAAGAPSLLPGDPRLEHQGDHAGHGHHGGDGEHGHHGDHGGLGDHEPPQVGHADHGDSGSGDGAIPIDGADADFASEEIISGTFAGVPDIGIPIDGVEADIASEEVSSGTFAGVPDIAIPLDVLSVPALDPASGGIPDLTFPQSSSIDYGSGIQVTEQRPGQTGHHNPFNPDYRPVGVLSQAPELFGGRPIPTRKPAVAQRPVPTQKTTTRRPVFTQRTTTTYPAFITQSTTTPPPFPHQPVNSQHNRPANPFLPVQISLPALGGGRPQPQRPTITQPVNTNPLGGGRPQPQRPTTPQSVNTNPLGGPAGAKGPVVNMCPGPASALPCVPDDQCDPYSGYVISDGYTLPYPITASTPTVAVLPCRLRVGVIGVCCRKFPRLRPTTTTAPPTGVDYGQGLGFVTARPRPGQQHRPSNVFLPTYKAATGI